MRITCPNCDAEYDVPREVIPDAGRDVQCSNCGQTWWQDHPDHKASADAEETELVIDAPEPDRSATPEDTSENEAPASAANDGDDLLSTIKNMSETDAAQVSRDAAVDRAAAEVDALAQSTERARAETEAKAAQAARAANLDPDVAQILQDEAAHEARAREADGLESQPDLGIGDPEDRRESESRERLARLKGEGEPEAAIATAEGTRAKRRSTRSELLPDIDEINSTLRGAAPEPTVEEVQEQHTKAKRRGFGFGFTLILLIVLIAVLLYLFAPQLIRAVPALEGPVTSYVDMVDGARAWISQKMEAAIDGMSGGDETNAEPASDG